MVSHLTIEPFSHFMIPELKVFFIAMSPIIELRGAIPLALKVYHMPVLEAYILSVVGNLVPLIGIVVFGKPIAEFLSKTCSCFEKFFAWLFAKVGKRANLLLGKTGAGLAILILTAIPIPFVGGWTGAIAAVLLGVPKIKGLMFVAAGAATSGIIVIALTLGI